MNRLFICLALLTTALPGLSSEAPGAPSLIMTDVAAHGQTGGADPGRAEGEVSHGNSARVDKSSSALEIGDPDSEGPVKTAETVDAKQRDFRAELLNAQRLRRAKETKSATQVLVNMLQANAPEKLKQVALLELAMVARDDNDLLKAQQIYSQWTALYPKDPSVPKVLLQQGILYRKMGSDNLARNKFFAVMTAAVNLPPDHFAEYQRLVLHAQTQIADTYYSESNYTEAADFYKRLLKSDSPELDKSDIQFKLIRTYSLLNLHQELIAQARDFVQRYLESGKLAEVRFLLAKSLKATARNSDSLQQVMILLESKSRSAAQSPADWAYWQQRTGNEIANQLYQEGDYLKALTIYENLSKLDTSVPWQFPVWYQIGLVFEKLSQPQQAKDYYNKILDREKELAAGDAPGLRTVIDMARWRIHYLDWEMQADKKSRDLKNPPEEPQTASAAPPPAKP
jgi:tetratricopeptide (TPR) repeat protein